MNKLKAGMTVRVISKTRYFKNGASVPSPFYGKITTLKKCYGKLKFYHNDNYAVFWETNLGNESIICETNLIPIYGDHACCSEEFGEQFKKMIGLDKHETNQQRIV